MLSNKRETSARSEDLFPLSFSRRRTDRGVQTSGKPNALSSVLYSRRVARLQDQVDRLQQRNVDLEEEHRIARQSFQNRLQQLHESWQDCFDRHQHTWSQEKTQAESATAEERHHLQAQIMQLTSALAGQPSRELMEDAAVQAGTLSAKDRSSQTPRPSTPRPSRASTEGVWDLLRTQSLPSGSQEWLSALVSSEAAMAEFGTAAAEYALTVAEGSLSVGDYSQAASSFARAAALYAQGMSQDAPALTDSFLSCSSSDASSLSDGMSQFFPLQEEVAGKAEKAPVADQSWWDEFGEWESASKVSHLPQPRHTTCLTQPRLVIGDDVVRLPIARLAAQLPYASFPEAFSLPIYSVANKTKLTLNDDIFMTPVCSHKPSVATASSTPSFTSSAFAPEQNLADNDDIWQSLQAADAVVKPRQMDSKRALEEGEELHTDPKVQKARFPSPSSAPWAPQDAQDKHVNLSLPWSKFQSSSSNPWGLQESAFPVIEIGFPKHSFEADVTYTPVEDFQPLRPKPTNKNLFSSNVFSGATGFPVTFNADSDFADDSSSHMEVMDMSAGDLVSVGGPDSCPWDGTSSMTQHSTPSFPKSSMEERFAADLDADSKAQLHQVADSTAALSEQGSQTESSPAEQRVQSRRELTTDGSLLSVRSAGQKRYLATLDELAGLLLPQSCRVAARVSTKLPSLDHNPVLPPLPEGFILPPEMHPVVGSYSKPAMSTTGSQTAAAKPIANAASQSDAASPAQTAKSAENDHMREEGVRGGRWLHPKQAPPAAQARLQGDLADQAAASMNLTTEELLAASPMTDLLKDVLSYSHDQPEQDIDLPTFTSRLADSGFMTCQLAQILAPIRTASVSLASSDSSPATPPKTAHLSQALNAAAPAVATADPAVEARLEAAVQSLLAEIGIDCSSPLMRADSDACSDFEMVSRAASDVETAFSTETFGANQWLGPAVQLVKTTSAPLDSASFDSAESAAFYSPSRQSAAASTPFECSGAFEREDVNSRADAMTSSAVSVEDVKLDMAGNGSSMTIQEAHPAAVCFAAMDDAVSTGFDESASETGSCSESILSLVSATSFGDDSTEAAGESAGSPDEWEII